MPSKLFVASPSRLPNRRNVLALSAAASIAALGASPAWADTCRKFAPMPEAVGLFVERVRLALQSSLLVQGSVFFLSEVETREIRVPKNYCADAKGGSPLAIIVQAQYSLLPTDGPVKALALEDQKQREIDEANKSPQLLELKSQVDSINKERNEVLRKHRAVHAEAYKQTGKTTNTPATDEINKQLGEVNERLNKAQQSHRIALEQATKPIKEKFDPEIYRLGATPTVRVKLSVNDYVYDAPRFGYVLGSGRAASNAVKVVRTVAEFEGLPQAEDLKEIQAQRYAEIQKMVDRPKLQAMISGNIPSEDNSRALIAKQADEMKIVIAKAREDQKAFMAAAQQERRRLQQARQGRTAPAAAAPAPAANTNASAPAAAPAPAQQQTSAAPAPAPAPSVPSVPSVPNAPAAVVDGVNKLRGLFGR